ncbi:RNA polymerase sigma-70 factor, ECF subfamily [Mucilaginibacter lappiensis]|uniref:RNA polymerase sigma-70 factor (ECF subfamily) n=1 Tax=Mucilaginibacter lappiensis TaxID=354630 RepID=A0ABR6PPE0_9SPHI|nr:sigma-70 family RNA polymerase sigma factor [Mucilaginibacter lappiensis]MBB6111501.1 RNA polymerase sigma-70 factor (ECF subfamily) [Mucilaginibacter lappiensis]SIR80338.1 RNA polymerase sigma-70 factor, ECF subfamily [Mucilaginibacter lappiensis]
MAAEINKQELLPHLFRTEYRKITAVLYKHFGFEHPEIAEDIASDTFLTAAEVWGLKGLPDNPVAWLYTVARNKAKDHLRRNKLFTQKITGNLQAAYEGTDELVIDLSDEHIRDSQLQLMFAICQPILPPEAQIGLALRILCGFGINEIADAFLSNKESINKRLFRAKEKLREQNVRIEFPPPTQISTRIQPVLTTLYLLFNEGYYSSSKDTTLRKDLCLEALRLAVLLTENKDTNLPDTNALIALMCFHASRFEARTDEHGEMIRYDEQDTSLWNAELIAKGNDYLNRASQGDQLGKYHLEAGIAYWHTINADTTQKWENILQLYNGLLQVAYSPIAALNRTYALYKARGKQEAITEAEKLQLNDNHLYHVLLGHLYTGVDQQRAIKHLQTALKQAKTTTEKNRIRKDLEKLE